MTPSDLIFNAIDAQNLSTLRTLLHTSKPHHLISLGHEPQHAVHYAADDKDSTTLKTDQIFQIVILVTLHHTITSGNNDFVAELFKKYAGCFSVDAEFEDTTLRIHLQAVTNRVKALSLILSKIKTQKEADSWTSCQGKLVKLLKIAALFPKEKAWI